jgi:hypothetical protein
MTLADPVRGDRFVAWLRSGVFVAGAGFVALFAITALLRLRHHAELEWMEGAMLDVVLRVQGSKPLYVAPSIDYVPFIYPPLYFYVSAGACVLFGSGLFALRLVSFVSALGCMAIAFRFVQRETRDNAAASASAGLYAATFAAGGAWFDLARIDSLFLCLLLAALYALRFVSGCAGQIGGGVLLALAFATKQLALPIALPMLVFAVCCGRRWFAAAAVLSGAGMTWALDRLNGGWYTYYVFAVPARHALSFEHMGELLRADLLGVLPIAAAFGVAWLCNAFGRTAPASGRDRAFYACMLGAMLCGSMLARVHVGGAVNAMHPVYAAIAIVFGLALSASWRGQPDMRRGARPRACVVLTGLLLLAQFYLLAYDPRAFIPARGDDAAAARLLARVRALPGDVLVPLHGFVSSAAGKPAYAHEMAVHDLYRSGIAWQRWKQIDDALDRSLRSGRFAAVLVDGDGWHAAALRAAYRREPLAPSESPAWPLTGMRTRPSALYVRAR